MATKLPGPIAPLDLARRHARVEVTVPVKRFRRLAEALFEADSDIAVALEFEPVDRDMAVLRGSVSGDLRVVCQRCLQPMWHAMDLRPALLFRTKGARDLGHVEDESLEPVELDAEGMVDLAELVEDELILGLPTIARHPPDACPANRMRFGPTLEEKPEGEENPFAVLQELLKTNKSPSDQ